MTFFFIKISPCPLLGFFLSVFEDESTIIFSWPAIALFLLSFVVAFWPVISLVLLEEILILTEIVMDYNSLKLMVLCAFLLVLNWKKQGYKLSESSKEITKKSFMLNPMGLPLHLYTSFWLKKKIE